MSLSGRVPGGDPDPESTRPDDEAERRVEVDRLAVDSGVDGRGGVHLELRRGPRPPRAAAGGRGLSRTMTPSWPLSSVGRVPGARGGSSEYGLFDTSTTAGLRCVRPRSSTSCRSAAARARSENVRRRLEERARLGVPVGRLPNSVAVDPERDVVEEEAAVHLRDVDPALDAVGERVERAEQVVAIDAEVEREVVARAGGHADEREPCATAAAATTASDPSPPAMPSASAPRATASATSVGKIVVRAQDDHLDSALARPLGEAGTRSLAAARPRVDEQHGLLRGIGGSPAGMHGRHDQPMLTALRRGGSPAGSSLRDSSVLDHRR